VCPSEGFNRYGAQLSARTAVERWTPSSTTATTTAGRRGGAALYAFVSARISICSREKKPRRTRVCHRPPRKPRWSVRARTRDHPRVDSGGPLVEFPCCREPMTEPASVGTVSVEPVPAERVAPRAEAALAFRQRARTGRVSGAPIDLEAWPTRAFLGLAEVLGRYHRHQVVHLERLRRLLRSDRPVLLVENHALDIVDPLLLLATILRKLHRVPRFIGYFEAAVTIGLASIGPQSWVTGRWFLRARGRWAGSPRPTGGSAATRWLDRAARRAALRGSG